MANASERQVPRAGPDMPDGPPEARPPARRLAGAEGLALHCDRVPFTLLSACKFSAALAIQPITAKEL